MSKVLFINGSPRISGKSARVIQMLKMVCTQELADFEEFDFEVARCDVAGCNGCEYCEGTNKCIIEDDMTDLLELLDSVDKIVAVTPTYFAGLPSQMKAVLDRFQQLYWLYLERRRASSEPLPKRSLILYVLGDGGDPHGYDALVTTMRSGFAVVGFRIEKVVPLVGITRIAPAHLELDMVVPLLA